VLARAFPAALVDEVIEATGTREVRRRLLPARLVVYFVLVLWLFRGRNSGYRQVMAKLADGLYHRRRGADLLAGELDPDGWVDAGNGRRWRQPNASSLSRARDKLGADPPHMLFEHVAGPVAAAGAPGVFCCGLRVISMDGSTTDVPDSEDNDAFFGRPSTASREGAVPQVRWVAAAESGTGALTGASFGRYGTGEQTLALDLLPSSALGMLVLADRNFLSWSLARAGERADQGAEAGGRRAAAGERDPEGGVGFFRGRARPATGALVRFVSEQAGMHAVLDRLRFGERREAHADRRVLIGPDDHLTLGNNLPAECPRPEPAPPRSAHVTAGAASGDIADQRLQLRNGRSQFSCPLGGAPPMLRAGLTIGRHRLARRGTVRAG
jgi:Insertion element 4 transposase N-terminal